MLVILLLESQYESVFFTWLLSKQAVLFHIDWLEQKKDPTKEEAAGASARAFDFPILPIF